MTTPGMRTAAHARKLTRKPEERNHLVKASLGMRMLESRVDFRGQNFNLNSNFTIST